VGSQEDVLEHIAKHGDTNGLCPGDELKSKKKKKK
jgi:hypothetical protein